MVSSLSKVPGWSQLVTLAGITSSLRSSAPFSGPGLPLGAARGTSIVPARTDQVPPRFYAQQHTVPKGQKQQYMATPVSGRDAVAQLMPLPSKEMCHWNACTQLDNDVIGESNLGAFHLRLHSRLPVPSLRRRAPINFAKIPSCIHVSFLGTPRLSFVRYDTRPVVNQSSYSYYFGFTTSILPLHWLAPLHHITPRHSELVVPPWTTAGWAISSKATPTSSRAVLRARRSFPTTMLISSPRKLTPDEACGVVSYENRRRCCSSSCRLV